MEKKPQHPVTWMSSTDSNPIEECHKRSQEQDNFICLLDQLNIKLVCEKLSPLGQLIEDRYLDVQSTICVVQEMLARLSLNNEQSARFKHEILKFKKGQKNTIDMVVRFKEEKKKLMQETQSMKVKLESLQKKADTNINKTQGDYQQEQKKSSDLELKLRTMEAQLKRKDQESEKLRKELERASMNKVSFRNSFQSVPVFKESSRPDKTDATELVRVHKKQMGLLKQENTHLRGIVENVYKQLTNILKFKQDLLQKKTENFEDSSGFSLRNSKQEEVLRERRRLDLLNIPLFAGRKAVLELDQTVQKFKKALKGDEQILQQLDKQDRDKVDLSRNIARLAQEFSETLTEQSQIVEESLRMTVIEDEKWRDTMVQSNQFMEECEQRLAEGLILM